MWRSSFLVNLQACRLKAGNFTVSFTGIFRQHFKPPMLPHCIDFSPPHQILKIPPMFSTPVGNPALVSSRNKPKLLYIYQCNAYGYQTWKGGNIAWGAFKASWSRGLARSSETLDLLCVKRSCFWRPVLKRWFPVNCLVPNPQILWIKYYLN